MLLVNSFLIDKFETIATKVYFLLMQITERNFWKLKSSNNFYQNIISDDLAKHTLSKRGKVIVEFNLN
jgi:hypothetical protein